MVFCIRLLLFFVVTPCGLVGGYQHLEEHSILIVQAIRVWPRVTEVQGVRARGIQKYMLNVLVPESFMKFMFSTVYRVTQIFMHVRTLQCGHLL
jgi:hypothetical protein